jgi:tRNA G37 N-methylase Trm5
MNAKDTLLELGSDLSQRYHWFSPASMGHPAKLHLGLVAWLVGRYTRPDETIADPMAGIGSTLLAATTQRHVIAAELEPHWVEVLRDNAQRIEVQAGLFAGRVDIRQADAREPWDYRADHLLFSPPYGCAASTTPNVCRSLPYRLREKIESYDKRWQYLIEHPTAGSMGALAFHYGTHEAQIGHLRGPHYWQAMEQVYTQAKTALRASGFMMVVIKDHIRQGERVPMADQTALLCQRLGFSVHARHQRRVSPLSLWQRRRKEAGLPVVEEEDVLIFTHAGGML